MIEIARNSELKAVGLGLCFLGAFSLWVYLSFVFAISGNADHFQRLGSFVVFGAVIFLSLSKNKAEREISVDLDRANVDSFIEEIAANRNTKTIVWKLREKFWRMALSPHVDRDRKKKLLGRLAFSEAMYLGIGTLQWGYGDLIVCWINGNGWRACG